MPFEPNSRASKIEEIIAKRKPKLDRINENLQSLNLLESKLTELRRFRDQHVSVVDTLKSTDFESILARIKEQKTVYSRLKVRFERSTLNIGVIGIARQGKSTLLQTLSGLTNQEIPSREGLPCTSVQSTLTHSPDQPAKAKVYFYSNKSFIERVINPYFVALGYSNIRDIHEFRQWRPPQIPDNPKLESIYNHLVNDYHKNLDSYFDELKDVGKEIEISSELIPKYVSQSYDPVSKKATSFTHLAVDKVEISCNFPEVGAERIALVDMPGLGDTRLGDEERMIKALGEDVDIILFVRKPDPHGDFWNKNDISLYETAYAVLEERLPLELWSFMIINRTSDNHGTCDILDKTRSQTPIRVAKCLTNNCKDYNEANEVLEEALQYLSRNVAALDKRYLSSYSKDILELKKSIDSEVKIIQSKVESYANEFSLFGEKSEEFKKNLFKTLEQLRHKIRTDPITEDAHFKHKIDEAIERCKTSSVIPSDEEILELYTRIGSRRGTCDIFLHRIREYLLSQFHEIEFGLQASLREKKKFISDVLARIGLSHISDDEGVEFLKYLSSRFDEHSNIRLGIEFLVEFELLYKGGLQNMVWKNLVKSIDPEFDPKSVALTSLKLEEIAEAIAPVVTDAAISAFQNSAAQAALDTASPAVSAIAQAIKAGLESHASSASTPISSNGTKPMQSIVDSIRTELIERHSTSVHNCQIALNQVTVIPTEVGRSMIEEFIDHLLRSKDSERDWNQFLYAERANIWSEFKEIEHYQNLRDYGLQLIRAVLRENQTLLAF